MHLFIYLYQIFVYINSILENIYDQVRYVLKQKKNAFKI